MNLIIPINAIWLLAPILCYIVEGPGGDTASDEAYWKTLMSAPEDDEGVVAATYSYTAGLGTILNEGVTEVGPLTGIYDPEWDAFIAGELI